MSDAAEIVRALLDVLPDSDASENECWDWCWNELNDDAQEAVKKARKRATMWLAEQGEP